MGKFAEQIDGILNGEMTIHKQYAKKTWNFYRGDRVCETIC